MKGTGYMSQEDGLVVGVLVQWTEAKTYGVVTHVDDKKARVLWDEEGLPLQFALGAPTLLRVNLTGSIIQRKSTRDNGIALVLVDADTPTWKCQVITNAGSLAVVNVPEADLRPSVITDPVERFNQAHIGSLQQYRLQEVTRWYRAQHLYNDLVSLGNVRVDIKPHQVSVVHRVVTSYPHRFLLCDEVGLGKTIEAGMVVKELRAKGGAHRVLAIVPPNLVRQWQFEMKTKFNESFAVLNTDTVKHLQNQGQVGNPFIYYDSILCSSGWIANPKWAKLCAAVDWDLVIVDEAHHARSHSSGETTRLYTLVKELAAPNYFSKRGMLFLTATPMQLDTHELYSLVELLDPTLFPSKDHFERHRLEIHGLSRLVERLSRHGFPLPDEESEQTASEVAKWLDLDDDLALQRLSAGEQERETLVGELADRHLLSEVLIRNRKTIVGGFMPRVASRWEVELTSREKDALQAIEDYVQYGFQIAEGTNNAPIGFVMVIFQKLMASSIAAVRESLGKRREKIRAQDKKPLTNVAHLEEQIVDDNEVGDVVASVSSVSDTLDWELILIDRAIASLNLVEEDSKARVLVEQLSTLFKDDPNGKILLFTQFLETQRHLAELLTAKGWGVNTFHGQMKIDEKDTAVERFKNEAGPQVLISTEAGGEGRNFQFCHILVNYDLPWNPMRVEQRIGRVDRIGQDHAVNIFNLWVKGTIEERVLDVLEKRIRVFEETIGGLDPILGETESDIQKIMRIAGEKQEEAIEEFGKRLEEEVRHAREAEKKLGDFIMDTKSYRKQLAERIAGQSSPINYEDLDKFVRELLASASTHIKRSGEIYELTFHGEILDSLSTQFVGGSKRKAVFRPDQRPDSEEVEFMAFGHPIVDKLVSQVLDKEYEGVTGTRRILADDDLKPCAGWLFTFQFTVSGMRPIEYLAPVFISDDGRVSLEIGHSLVQHSYRFDDTEQNIDVSEIPANLDEAEVIASRVASDNRETLQRQAETQATERVEREINRLNELFDYKERVAKDRVEATQITLNRIRSSGDESQRQILPVWEANLRRDKQLLDNLAVERLHRLSEADKHRHPQVDWTLKSLARIEVVAEN